MKDKQCPYCKKDLSNAMRLLGGEVFSMHVRMHEADFYWSIYDKIEVVEWYYKKEPPITQPYCIATLLNEFQELRRFYQILEEYNNEEEKVSSQTT